MIPHESQPAVILLEGVGGVAEIIFHLLDLHRQLARSLQLLFNHFCQRIHFFGLGSHETVIFFDGGFLRISCILQVCTHFVSHGFQDANNFTAGWCIIRGSGQECHEVLSICILQLLIIHDNFSQQVRSGSLKKTPPHAFLDRCSCFGDACNICFEIGCGFLKCCALLLPDPCGFSHCFLRCCSVSFVVFDVFLHLCKLAFSFFNCRLQFWSLGLRISNALCKITTGVLAVTHIFVIQFLLLLTLSLHLGLQSLHHGDNLANRIRGRCIT